MLKDKLLKYYVHSSADAYYCVLKDETVIFVPRDGSFYSFNRAGSKIWELADGSRTLGQICRMISGEYGIPAKDAAADVSAFIRRLAKKGLLYLKANREET